MKSKKLLALVVSAVMVLSLAACGGDKGTEGEAAGTAYPGTADEDTYVVDFRAEPPELNSLLTSDVTSGDVLRMVISGLYRLDENDQPVPDLAEDTQISDDGCTYTMKLREDATWSNGEPVTAHDFVFAYQTICNPKTGSVYAYIVYDNLLHGNEVYEGTMDPSELGVKALDDYTLEVTFNTPLAYALNLFDDGDYRGASEQLEQLSRRQIYRSQVKAKFESNAFWRAICKVGFIRRYLHRVAGKKLMKVFGRRLRFLGIGGAKLDSQTEKFLLEARVPYAIGYGLTETAPLLAGAAPSQVRLGSTGPACKGLQLRLDDVNPETGQGEIVALTPSVMRGYYKNPEATAEAFTADGWFRTGDLGCFDEDGFLYIRGRLKNMIVGPSGENIYPEDIETVLNSHVYISESVVTQQQGQLVALVHFDTDALEARYEEWRENLGAKLDEFEHWKEGLKKEIIEYVNSKVNKFSHISDVVEEKEEFVKTPTHKIKRFLYNKKDGNAAKGTAASPEENATHSEEKKA